MKRIGVISVASLFIMFVSCKHEASIENLLFNGSNVQFFICHNPEREVSRNDEYFMIRRKPSIVIRAGSPPLIGEWRIEKDTLIINYRKEFHFNHPTQADPQYSFYIDSISNISYDGTPITNAYLRPSDKMLIKKDSLVELYSTKKTPNNIIEDGMLEVYQPGNEDYCDAYLVFTTIQRPKTK